MRHKIIPVFIPHASCPNQCVYCNQNKITAVSAYDTGSVKDTIENCIRSFRDDDAKREIAFYGGSFTAIEREKQCELLELAKSYIDKGSVDSIRVSTRPDCIDEETLMRLSSFRVETVELGVQSMCDGVLNANERGHTKEDTVKASKLIKDAGLTLGHQIMPGLYTDTKETMLITAKESLELKPDFLRVYPCLVVRDTKLHELYLNGEYVPLTLEDAVEICKKIYLMAASTDTKIIRMGIHPDSDFVNNGFVTGPFHPAFKYLVVSSLFYDMAKELVTDNDLCGEVTFYINMKDIGNFTGNQGGNVKRLKDECRIDDVDVVPTEEVDVGGLLIKHGGDRLFKRISEMPVSDAL